jgi:tripartite-type tricarboxylate transporter receptor subunit TctC
MRRSIGIVAVGIVTLAAVTGCANLGQGGSTGPSSSATSSFPDGEVVEIIVGYDAGGNTDVLTRIVAEGMAAELGSEVQVVNLPGAGGSVGLSELAVSDPDGLTIGTFNIPSALSYIDPTRQLPYDRDSFVPVAGLALSPTVVAVRADAPWKTFKDLVKAAAADPGNIILAGGTNSTSDDALTVTALENDGVDFNVVTIGTGGADKTTQLLGGQLQVTVGSLGSIQVAVQSGQVRLLAQATAERSTLLPDVPTLTELGYDINTSGSVTLAAPADTPQEYIDALDAAIKSALESPELIKTANAAGSDIVYISSAELGKYWDEQEKAAREILGL